MSGIYIKGMEMPPNCMLSSFCVPEADEANGEMCMVTGKLMPPCNYERLDDCPLISVADVRPVVRGEWEHDGFNWFCNRCNYNALCDKDTGEEVLSPRCPNCGARMNLTYKFPTGGTYTCKNTQEVDT